MIIDDKEMLGQLARFMGFFRLLQPPEKPKFH